MVPGDEPIGTVAHRLGAVGLGVGEGRLGHRIVGVVAQTDLEVRRRGVQLDREGEVVDLGQAGQLGVLVVGEALDPLEEGGAELGVGQQGSELPGLDEGVGCHRAAVREGPARFEGDRVVLVVLGLDGGGHLVDDVAVLVIADQAGEDQVEDPPTVGLIGVGGQQGVLRLGEIGQDDAVVGAGAGLLVDRDTGPVEVDVGGVAGVAAEPVLVPQRDAGQVGEELGLGLAEVAVGGLGIGGGRRLIEQVVEGLRGVLGVVRAGAGLEGGVEEVLQRGVVGRPSGAEGAQEGVLGNGRAHLGELGHRQGLHGDAQDVGHRVAHGLGPGLVGTIGVVGQGQLAAAAAQAASARARSARAA